MGQLDLHTHLSQRHGEILDSFAEREEFGDRRRVLEKAVELLDAIEGIDITEVLEICQKKKIEEDLRKRTKELSCLYGITEIVEHHGSDINKIMMDIVELIPQAWQYPDITCARINCCNGVFHTTNFRKSKWKQTVDIVVIGKKIGSIEVYLLKKKPLRFEGPFSKEERKLLNGISERISTIIERNQMDTILKESEEKFRTLAEQSPNMIFIYQKGKVAYANKKCEEIIGYTKETLCSPDFDFLNLIAPEYQSLVKKNLATHLKSKEIQPYEYALITKGGKRIETIITTKLIQYENDQALLGIVTDITDRKQIEKALRDSEEFSSTLLNNAAFPIMVANPDSALQYINPAMERLTGFTPLEILGKKLPWPWWPKDMKDKMTKNFDLHTKYGAWREEDKFQKKNGESFWVEVSGISIKNKGKIKYYLANWVDITERKQIEESLKKSEEKFHSLVEYAGVGIATTNLKGQFTYVNPALANLIGYSVQELKGRSFRSLLHPKDRGRVVRLFLNIMLLRRQPRNMEFRAIHKDGSTMHLMSKPTKFMVEGKHIGFQAIIIDLTEIKKREET